MKNELTVYYLILLLTSVSLADTCPPAASSINPNVTAKVTVNKKTGFYRYEYTLSNGADALIPLQLISFNINKNPVSITSPKNWVPDFYNLSNMPIHFQWEANANIRDTKKEKIYGSLVADSAIRAGKNLSGFSFESQDPPGIIQYNAEGSTGVPTTTPTQDDDEPSPSCPGWNNNSPRYQTLVTGVTTGPSNQNTVSVSIRMRDEKQQPLRQAIDPAHPTGNLKVLVLATADFDPAQIDTSTLKFGPAGVSPISSKLVPVDSKTTLNLDEREEWEKICSSIHPPKDDGKAKKFQNLSLEFNQASLEIQCVLDKALFLTGKTKDGANIIGGVSSKLAGCDIHRPGIRPNHKKHDVDSE